MTPLHPSGAPDHEAGSGAPDAVSAPGDDRPAGRSGHAVRPARREDVAEILAMVRDLAAYEKAEHEVRATESTLVELLFGDDTHQRPPAAFCHVATSATGPGADTEADVRLSGFALWFVSTSTWTGRHGIYLEDLYVRPAHRGGGIGVALMSELARICVERGYTRLEWSVLDWNTPAWDFYRSLGATAMDEWTVHRLTSDALAALAARATAS